MKINKNIKLILLICFLAGILAGVVAMGYFYNELKNEYIQAKNEIKLLKKVKISDNDKLYIPESRFKETIDVSYLQDDIENNNKLYRITNTTIAQNLWEKECTEETSNNYMDRCLTDLLNKVATQRKEKVNKIKETQLNENEFIVNSLTDWKSALIDWSKNFEENKEAWCKIFNLSATRQCAYDLCELEVELFVINELDYFFENINIEKIELVEIYAKLKQFSTAGNMKFYYYDTAKDEVIKNSDGNVWFWAGVSTDEESTDNFVNYIEEDRDSVFKIVGARASDDCGYLEGFCFEDINIEFLK